MKQNVTVFHAKANESKSKAVIAVFEKLIDIKEQDEEITLFSKARQAEVTGKIKDVTLDMADSYHSILVVLEDGNETEETKEAQDDNNSDN